MDLIYSCPNCTNEWTFCILAYFNSLITFYKYINPQKIDLDAWPFWLYNLGPLSSALISTNSFPGQS